MDTGAYENTRFTKAEFLTAFFAVLAVGVFNAWIFPLHAVAVFGSFTVSAVLFAIAAVSCSVLALQFGEHFYNDRRVHTGALSIAAAVAAAALVAELLFASPFAGVAGDIAGGPVRAYLPLFASTTFSLCALTMAVLEHFHIDEMRPKFFYGGIFFIAAATIGLSLFIPGAPERISHATPFAFGPSGIADSPYFFGANFLVLCGLIALRDNRTRARLWSFVVQAIILLNLFALHTTGPSGAVWFFQAELAFGAMTVVFMLGHHDSALLYRLTHHTTNLTKRNLEIEELIELQNKIASALPSRAKIIPLILDFLQAQTRADGCIFESVQGDELIYESCSGSLSEHTGIVLPIVGSLSGQAIREDCVLVCADTHADPRVARAACDRLHIRSMVVMPLTLSETRRFVLKIASSRPNSFGSDEMRVLKLTANYLLGALRATEEFHALEHAEIEQRRYSQQLAALHIIASSAVDSPDDQIYAAMALVLEQLELDEAFFFRIEHESGELVTEHALDAGGTRAPDIGKRITLADSLGADIIASRDTVVIDEFGGIPDGAMLPPQVTTAIAIPVFVDDICYGVLQFAGSSVRVDTVAHADLSFLRTTADLIGTAIDRAKARERLDHLAFFDSLTGLPNRVLLEDRLAQILLTANRRSERFAVLFLDLDGFKAVNDRLGHAAGDCVLRASANRLQLLMRASDTIARVGGDEFIIIAPNVGDYMFIEQLAARIITALDEPVMLPSGESVVLGTSIGASLYPLDGIDAQTLVQKADLAMYQAKMRGKGRLQLASEIIEPGSGVAAEQVTNP